ncbi:hypothetical protein ACIQXD_00065 [Streptomyces uncialis]|uniref:hypothetical protein n=1 Tax=Streptomyces uncialis TaxID=1048205 RepID=UPI0038238BCC
MTHYTLPPLYSPVRPELHPDAELIQDRTTRWRRTIGLCAAPEAERAVGHVMAGDMAARWSVRQPRERVQWVSDFWCLGAVLDDQRREAGDGAPGVVGPFIGGLWPDAVRVRSLSKTWSSANTARVRTAPARLPGRPQPLAKSG